MGEVGPRFLDDPVISDPGIPTLPDALDTTTIGTHLRRAIPDRGEAIEEIRFQVLKHHPGSRCTFEVAFRSAEGCGSVIGKVYAADRSDVHRAMEDLSRAGFGPDEAWAIPKPLAYVPELQLLLQEKVEGSRAKEVFLTGNDRDRGEASRRCARWLARFHAVAPRSAKVSERVGDLNSVPRWCQTIGSLGEPVASKARRLCERLQEKAAWSNGIERCAGHGSYSCHQILLTQDRTVTLDWDSHGLADPRQDVARFIVALQRLAFKYLGSIRALDAAADLFLRTYQSESPFPIAANLAWYRAFTCLLLAKYEANRPVCTFREGIDALLDEGVRVLEGEGIKAVRVNGSTVPETRYRVRTSPKVAMNAEALLSNSTRVLVRRSELPFDPALPGLALLCDPSLLAATLARVSPGPLGSDRRMLESRAYLRRLIPGKRCTVELELFVTGESSAAPERRLLGKIYGDGRQGAMVYRALRALRRHGFGEGRFVVPEPLAYLPDYHLLLLSWAEGELLSSVFLNSSDAAREVAGAAEWLLRLHDCEVRTGRRYSFLDHLNTLAVWKGLLAQAYPQGEEVLADLLARFEERGGQLAGWTPRPTHRDFYPEHVVVDGHQWTGLDFDEFCQYDPLFDVAHFTAHLRFLGLTRFGDLKHFDSVTDRFLAAYQAGGGACSEERLKLYEAVTYFKLVRFVALVPWSKGYLVQRPQGWMEIVPELLSEAQRRV